VQIVFRRDFGALRRATREAVVRRLRFALTRFSPRIQQVSVTIRQGRVFGNGEDQLCQVAIRFTDDSISRITGRGVDVEAAAANAADRAARVAARTVDRLHEPRWDRRMV